MGTDATNGSSNADAWVMKFIDVMWVRPIMEVKDAVHREGDRIVQIVQGRAHERIYDQVGFY